MKIAVEGCAHGELEKIYETIQALEIKQHVKIDLLIICGDFQSVRNPSDLESMAVPPKYRKMNSFYKYYSGEKVAPILTIFVGGNHEASNYLSELAYGGWVCPNIYYMGHANVINVGGLRIAGLSGIYKGQDYLKGHFESPPYDKSSVKSVYHVRNLDVFRLKQVKKPIDICISHDWPRSVYKYGDMEQLLRFKPFFRDEMESDKLGSPPGEELLMKLKPSFWFAAHLHCKFSAVVPHKDSDRPFTKFLALDKCLPKRRFLQVLDLGENVYSPRIEYDLEWLAILRNTNHLLTTSKGNSFMPGVGSLERWDFAPNDAELQTTKDLFDSNLEIPLNFVPTAKKYYSGTPFKTKGSTRYINPQTQRLCKILSITDPNQAVYTADGFTISDFSCNETDINTTDATSDPDKESSTDEEATEEYSVNEELEGCADFFIDRVGALGYKSNSNKVNSTPDKPDVSQNKYAHQFLGNELDSKEILSKSLELFPDIISSDKVQYKQNTSQSKNLHKFLGSELDNIEILKKNAKSESFPEIKSESFPEIKSELSTSDEVHTKQDSSPIVFKRRNTAMYSESFEAYSVCDDQMQSSKKERLS